MLLLARPIGLLPQATLAAVVIVYSIGLIQPEGSGRSGTCGAWSFAGRWRAGRRGAARDAEGDPRGDRSSSLASLAHQVADPPVYAIGRKRGTNVFRARTDEHPDDEPFPGLLLVRVEGRVFFATRSASARSSGRSSRRRAQSRRARPARGVRPGVHRAQDADRGRRSASASAGCRVWLVGLNPAVLERRPALAAGERLAASGCTSTWRPRSVAALPQYFSLMNL